jgi:hypothetical protein
MQKVLVNKPTDPWQLKILFPSIKIALDGVPAYGKVVYSNFQFSVHSATELLFEQSLSGFNLDSHLGLLSFLKSCNYMSKAKLDRFELAGREPQKDSKGNVVVPEGIFYNNPDVLEMYFFVSTLRLSNKVFVQEGIEAGYVLDVLEAPLYIRLVKADSIGPGVFMEKALRLLDSFFSSDIQFKARKHGNVSGFERMQRLMGSFNQAGFKNFKLSGNDEEDVYSFLCLFGA